MGLHPGPLHGKPAKLLGLDVGLARIGVAVCDPLQLGARPLYTLHRTSRRADFARLAETLRAEEVTAIICGLPLNMDGSEGEQALSTRKWALRLAQAMRLLLGQSIPVIFWDERLSTFAAQEILRAQPKAKAVQKDDDATAASVILQSYLERKAAIEYDPARPYDAIVLPD